MTRTRFFGVLSVVLFLMGTAPAVAQHEKKPETKPADTKSPATAPADKKPTASADKKPGDAGHGGFSEADMAKMMEMAKPGADHDKLKTLAGKWTFVTKARMGPDDQFEESKGKAEYRWILGGRVLVQEVKAEPGPHDMGGPFEGFGMTGFDNMTKKYWNTWADSMSTGVMISYGTADASGKTFTYTGEYDCPITGQRQPIKSVLKIAGDDKVLFEMYGKDPAGKEFKSLEVTYSRVK